MFKITFRIKFNNGSSRLQLCSTNTNMVRFVFENLETRNQKNHFFFFYYRLIIPTDEFRHRPLHISSVIQQFKIKIDELYCSCEQVRDQCNTYRCAANKQEHIIVQVVICLQNCRTYYLHSADVKRLVEHNIYIPTSRWIL